MGYGSVDWALTNWHAQERRRRQRAHRFLRWLCWLRWPFGGVR